MITKFSSKNKNEYYWLLEFLTKYTDYDFYYTSNNNRVYITDIKSLKTLLKDSISIYVQKVNSDYTGIILVSKSSGAGVIRYYVKIVAQDASTARDLLTVLTWNFTKDLFIKIKKNSNYLDVFKSKGFRFAGERGVQILLNRKHIPLKTLYKKEDDEEKTYK